MNSQLQNVIDQISSLNVQERELLRNWLDVPATSTDHSATKLTELLQRRGIISQAPTAATRTAARVSREFVSVEGKPVSETIIEERR